MVDTSLARRLRQAVNGDWLGQAIESAEGFEEPEMWEVPNLEIHPSGAGSPCPRDIQLAMLGHRTKIKRLNRRRMDNGTDAHARWTKDLQTMGLLESAGVRLKIDGEWSGEYDLLCRNPHTGRVHLGEIKTMNENRFRKVPPQDSDYTRMAHVLAVSEGGYVTQMTQYLVKFMEDGRYPDLSSEVFFLFENTNNQDYCIRWFRPDDVLIEKAFKNSRIAQESSRSGALIPPPFARRSMTCSSCYRELMCYSLQDGDLGAQARVSEALRVTKGGLTGVYARHEGREALVADGRRSSADDELIDWG